MMSAASNENILRRNAEADEALNEYHDSGQYVSYTTMGKWLKTWGTEKEKQCPTSQN